MEDLIKRFELRQKMEDKRLGFTAARARYLVKSGWKTTCETPGCVWLWEKEIKGKNYAVTEKIAAEFQTSIDLCGPLPYRGEEKHPEGYEGGYCGCDTCVYEMST